MQTLYDTIDLREYIGPFLVHIKGIKLLMDPVCKHILITADAHKNTHKC